MAKLPKTITLKLSKEYKSKIESLEKSVNDVKKALEDLHNTDVAIMVTEDE
jgi:hypothetical protein